MQFSIRASSLSTLFDCPARFEATQINGKSTASSPKAAIGTALHAATAAFDLGRLNRQPISTTDAAGVFVSTLSEDKTVDWNGGDKDFPNYLRAEQRGILLTQLYCEHVAPRIHYTAVEVQAAPAVIECANGVELVLTGTIDRRYEKGGKTGIADIKSGVAVFDRDGQIKTQGYAPQLAIYELLDELFTGAPHELPALVIAAKTKGVSEVDWQTVPSSRELLLGNQKEPGLLDMAAGVLQSGLFYGNPRSMMCDKKYCPNYNTCKWRK